MNEKPLRDVICGMVVDPAKHQSSTFEGKEYYFCSEGCKNKFDENPKNFITATDPICGMTVHRDQPADMVKHDGEKYYFCGFGCANKFREQNGIVVEDAKTPSKELPKPTAGQKVTYICPMCPEIVSAVPADCPKCGMALEPSTPTLEGEDVEYKYFLKLFWSSLILSLPVVVLEMGSHFGIELIQQVPIKVSNLIQLILTSVIVLILARPIFHKFWSSLANRSLNMWSLIGLGTGVAYLYSVVGYFFGDLFPDSLKGVRGEIPLYFESAAVIVVLVFVGQVLELKARSKTTGAIQALIKLTPDESWKLIDGVDTLVKTDTLMTGDHVRIKPGEKIPTDGVIVEGSSSVDESLLTGESIPIEKTVGDELVAGSINTTGTMIFEVKKVGTETKLGKIIQLVADAQRTRPPIQKIADRVAGFFVPTVVLVSVISFWLWFILGPEPTIAYAIINAVAVLIIACPCAIGLATPISIVTAIGRGAEHGLLIKSAETLELFSKIDQLVIDKTGTLTEGKPTVSGIEVYDESVNNNDLLTLAASLSEASEHPLSAAIVDKSKEEKLTLKKVEDFKSITGKGITGKIENQEIYLGSFKYLIELEKEKLGKRELAKEELNEYESKIIAGTTPVFVMSSKGVLGQIQVSDPVKPTTPSALKQLKKLGVRVLMATGDHPKTAEKIANELEISEFRAEMSPEDKAKWVEELKKKGAVAMAGDGVNDAPAISLATVGIAMGTGSDVAIESAGVTLTHGDLNSIIRLRELSMATMGNIKQNLFFAFFYNTVGIPIAAGLLFPWFGILLSPMFAAAAMSLSSVSVIGNALRLKSIQLGKK